MHESASCCEAQKNEVDVADFMPVVHAAFNGAGIPLWNAEDGHSTQ